MSLKVELACGCGKIRRKENKDNKIIFVNQKQKEDIIHNFISEMTLFTNCIRL